MTDLVTKKWMMSEGLAQDLHNSRAIAIRALVQQKENPRAFTISCSIEVFNFARALCDLGSGINLMPLVVFKKLGLETPTLTTIQLLIVYRTVKKPLGILYDVFDQGESFIFPTNMMTLDYEVYFSVPIILGRLFLASG